MKPYQFLLAVFAVWRATSLLTGEFGPYRIFVAIRWYMGKRYVSALPEEARQEFGLSEYPSLQEMLNLEEDDYENYLTFYTNRFAEGLECFWCSSIWLSTLITIGIYFFPKITEILIHLLALSTGAIIIHKKVIK